MDVDRERLHGVDFSGRHFSSVRASGAAFVGNDFTETGFDELSLGLSTSRQTAFRDCVFRRTRFPPFAFFGNVRFERCVFDRSRLSGQVDTQLAEFVDCVFTGRMRDINFWGRAHPSEGRRANAFTGNDFTGAELDGVAFHDIDLRAQRFPGLPGYALIDRVADRVRATLPLVERWPDERHRDEARRSLEFLAAYRGDEALVTPRDLGRKLPPALREELFEAIRRRSSDTSPDPGAPPREPDPEAP